MKNVAGRLHTIKPNRIEAGILADIEIRDKDSLKKAADRLHGKRAKKGFYNAGVGRRLYTSDGSESGVLPCIMSKNVNTTGAGDSFTAAVCWAYP